MAKPLDELIILLESYPVTESTISIPIQLVSMYDLQDAIYYLEELKDIKNKMYISTNSKENKQFEINQEAKDVLFQLLADAKEERLKYYSKRECLNNEINELKQKIHNKTKIMESITYELNSAWNFENGIYKVIEKLGLEDEYNSWECDDK